MSQSTSQPVPKYPVSYLAGFLSYLIPGLGQVYQGRIGKGLMFMVCLLGMFIGGQVLGDWRNVYLPRSEARHDDNPLLRQLPGPVRDVLLRWHYAGQFWIGIAAWPALWQYNHMPVPNKEQYPFWHNLQKSQYNPGDPKLERDLNEYLAAHDKMPDVAWVYTVIAGILNILVIYDAFAGPAHGAEEESLRKPSN